MKHLFLISGFFFLLPSSLLSQQVYLPQHLSSHDNGAYSDHFMDAYSFVTNRAALAKIEEASGGILSEQKFMLSELSAFSAVFSTPLYRGGAGVQFDYAGSANYNESKFGLAYGKPLGKKLNIGLAFQYHLFHVAGHGSAGSVQAELSLLVHPAPHLLMGLQVSNLPGGYIGGGQAKKLASVYTMGFGFEASEQVLLSAEIRKEETVPVSVRVGIDYHFDNQFFAGLGVETDTAAPYGKAGWQWKNMRIQLGVSYHAQLGFTPLLFMMMEGKKRGG